MANADGKGSYALQVGAFFVLIVVIAVSMFSASLLQGWALLFSLPN
jgi:hypothetical protein